MPSAGRGLTALTLFDFFQEAPGVILDGVFHYVLPPNARPDGDAPTLEVDGSVFPLLPGETLAEIEAEYLTDRGRPCPSASEVQQFVLDRLIPKLAVLSSSDRDKVIVTPELSQTTVARIHPPLVPGALARALGDQALVMEQRVWPLAVGAAASGALPDVCVHTPRVQLYADSPARPLRSVEVLFAAALTEQLVRRGRAHAQIDVQHAWSASVPLYDGQRYLYRDRQWAVYVRDGEIVLSCAIPAHVIESESGRLYQFDATRIGVSIGCLVHAHMVFPGSVSVLDARYEHLFVSSGGSPFQRICTVRPDSYYRRLHHLPLEDALCEDLWEARSTLLTGYHRTNPSGPYRGPNLFSHRLISHASARSLQLPVYPWNR